MRMLKAAPIAIVVGAVVFIWLLGSSNPVTPAGYVGYVTQGAIFGQTRFYTLQTGPISPGRTWLLSVANVSVTPYTYHEDFVGPTSVLSRDNLKISFSVHLVWKIRPDRVKEFVEKYSTLSDDRHPDRIVLTAYNNFLKEPLRTYARDEIQRLNGLEIKDRITPVGEAISKRVLELTKDTPFQVTSVVVGNIQYPDEVANAVATKMAATQVLERKQTEIAIEDYDPSPHLAEITAPLLAINSADDFVNPPELPMMRELITRVPKGRFVLLPITDQTRGHGTHSLPAIWGGELAALLAGLK